MRNEIKGFDRHLDTQNGLREYQSVADTVGMVPSLRIKDNVIQAICVGAGLIAGATVGALIAMGNKAEWYFGAMIGGVVGLVGATLLSGGVLMVLGWVRAARKLKAPGQDGGSVAP